MDVPECPELSACLAQAEAKILELEGIIRDLQDRLKPSPGGVRSRPNRPHPPRSPPA